MSTESPQRTEIITSPPPPDPAGSKLSSIRRTLTPEPDTASALSEIQLDLEAPGTPGWEIRDQNVIQPLMQGHEVPALQDVSESHHIEPVTDHECFFNEIL